MNHEPLQFVTRVVADHPAHPAFLIRAVRLPFVAGSVVAEPYGGAGPEGKLAQRMEAEYQVCFGLCFAEHFPLHADTQHAQIGAGKLDCPLQSGNLPKAHVAQEEPSLALHLDGMTAAIS